MTGEQKDALVQHMADCMDTDMLLDFYIHTTRDAIDQLGDDYVTRLANEYQFKLEQ